MNVVEQTIVEQFPFWRKAIGPLPPLGLSDLTVFVGCGSSYNLALSPENNGVRRVAGPGR